MTFLYPVYRCQQQQQQQQPSRAEKTSSQWDWLKNNSRLWTEEREWEQEKRGGIKKAKNWEEQQQK